MIINSFNFYIMVEIKPFEALKIISLLIHAQNLKKVALIKKLTMKILKITNLYIINIYLLINIQHILLFNMNEILKKISSQII